MTYPKWIQRNPDLGPILAVNAEEEAAFSLPLDAKCYPDAATSKPSEGLTVPELKEALGAKGIDIPEGAKKADLAALLDAAE